ncbi:MAG: DUF1523 family protein [Deltaproteobacteria bacterium]|nr:DUF1523 family protein [Deltaproteobacteria bacterium]
MGVKRKKYHQQKNFCLLIATDYRPFVNYDVWYRFKFDSGTIQNEAVRLKGKTVKIKKYGWRVPLFSEYENVVKIEEVR